MISGRKYLAHYWSLAAREDGSKKCFLLTSWYGNMKRAITEQGNNFEFNFMFCWNSLLETLEVIFAMFTAKINSRLCCSRKEQKLCRSFIKRKVEARLQLIHFLTLNLYAFELSMLIGDVCLRCRQSTRTSASCERFRRNHCSMSSFTKHRV